MAPLNAPREQESTKEPCYLLSTNESGVYYRIFGYARSAGMSEDLDRTVSHGAFNTTAVVHDVLPPAMRPLQETQPHVNTSNKKPIWILG